jgi:hypothetical protein
MAQECVLHIVVGLGSSFYSNSAGAMESALKLERAESETALTRPRGSGKAPEYDVHKIKTSHIGFIRAITAHGSMFALVSDHNEPVVRDRLWGCMHGL